MPRSSTLPSLLVVLLLTVAALATLPSEARAAVCPPGDADSDGILNVYEDVFGNGDCDDDDTDGDATPDYLDSDDDGDSVLTLAEEADPNGDGNPADARDTDGNGLPDYLDHDDDGDGIPTLEEDASGDGDPTNDDADGDGIPDYLDAVFNPAPSVPALGSAARLLALALSMATGLGLSLRSRGPGSR